VASAIVFGAVFVIIRHSLHSVQLFSCGLVNLTFASAKPALH
jgi:hypothetical protein